MPYARFVAKVVKQNGLLPFSRGAVGALVDYASRMAEHQDKLALEREIFLARQIQQRLFPAILPSRPDVQMAARSDPGRHVSGDYYDVIQLDGGRVGFVIADVTGEGVAASLLMSNLQAAVRLTMLGEADPGVLLGRWNRLTHENTEAAKPPPLRRSRRR